MLLSRITGRLAHAACCTCCLSSENWCSHSSPCSRCPGVPCRLSWTYTHSGVMSVGNKRDKEICFDESEGQVWVFPLFPSLAGMGLSLLFQRTDPSQAFVPPSQGGQGRAESPMSCIRTPPALCSQMERQPGAGWDLLLSGSHTHTNSNLAATTWVGNTSMELSLQQHPALMHSWGSHRGMPSCSACTGEGATASWAWRRPCAHCPFPKAELQGDIPSSEHKGKGGA